MATAKAKSGAASAGAMTSSGVGTGVTTAGGVGAATYLIAMGINPLLGGLIASVGAVVVGAAAEWGREKEAAGKPSFWTLLLSKLG